MKLPDPRDPGGDAEGAVLLKDVLLVLHDAGVAIKKQSDGLTRLEIDDFLEVHALPDPVPGSLVRYLARKLDIDLTEFYIAGRSGIH